MNIIKELYNYRQMIFSLVKRDLKGRYKGSVLGFMWTFINPLLQLIVYTIVFSIIMKNEIERYYLFLFVALVPWIFFSTSVSAGSTCVIGQQDMVKKIYFPREVLPLTFVTSQFVNMILSFVVIFAVIIVTGHGIGINAIIYLPIIMIIEYMIALGVTMLSSAITVYFKDLQYILNIVTMAWMYMTPVVYSQDRVPEQFKKLFYLNPITPIIIAYRDILYYKKIPDLSTLILAIIMGIVIILIGFFTFNKLKRRFVEEL